MAVGDVSVASAVKRTIELAAITGNVAAPTLATQGVPCYPVDLLYGGETGCFYSVEPPHSQSLVTVKVGGTTPSGVLTLWGYIASQDVWVPVVALNAGAAITSNRGELVTGLGHYDRLAVQAASVTGTTPSFDVRLTTTQRSGK